MRNSILLGVGLSLAMLASQGHRGVLSTAMAAARAGQTPDREAWGRVLDSHAHEGGLDYAGIAAAREDLDLYLDSLTGARPDDWGRDEQVAFWSNAYNAVVVSHVLDEYPGVESVRAVDGFFDELTFPVAGEELTLDEIEGRARDLGDPRVHFAVVCASTSCPDLYPMPFSGESLEEQLSAVTRSFLADRTKGMRLEPESGTLWLSSIFKWYAGDFTGGSTVLAFFDRRQVAGWIAEQVDEDTARQLRQSDPVVRYLDYDWSLNDRPGK